MEQIKSSVAVSCPNCGHRIDVEQALAEHYQAELHTKLASERKSIEERFSAREQALTQREEELEAKRERENELFLKKLKQEKQLLESQLKLKFRQDYDDVLREKNKELQAVEAQLLNLRQAEIENARLKRALSQQQKELELSFETQLNERLKTMEGQIAERERARLELALKEKEKQLDDQSKLIKELQHKSEQGSGQLQGEVQELAIEEWLMQHFPLDTIEEIKKGVRGADCIQHVHSRERKNCGTIYYESKRTKDFQPAWIEKFKDDMRDRSVDIGVLVTQAMPKDMDRMGLRNGVYICSFEEFKGLSYILREMVVRLSQTVEAKENKGEKMEFLYEFLTSNEFKLYVEGIVEGFTQMHDDLQREKNAMTRIWNQREKQIQKVLENTSGMFGAIKGIAGASLPDIDLLRLPDGDSEP
jgi:hypothetical protein